MGLSIVSHLRLPKSGECSVLAVGNPKNPNPQTRHPLKWCCTRQSCDVGHFVEVYHVGNRILESGQMDPHLERRAGHSHFLLVQACSNFLPIPMYGWVRWRYIFDNSICNRDSFWNCLPCNLVWPRMKCCCFSFGLFRKSGKGTLSSKRDCIWMACSFQSGDWWMLNAAHFELQMEGI